MDYHSLQGSTMAMCNSERRWKAPSKPQLGQRYDPIRSQHQTVKRPRAKTPSDIKANDEPCKSPCNIDVYHAAPARLRLADSVDVLSRLRPVSGERELLLDLELSDSDRDYKYIVYCQVYNLKL